jgi:hypothetical protein
MHGIMGPNMMGIKNIMRIQRPPLPVQQAIQMMNDKPVISHNDTIIFSSGDDA